MKTEEDLKFLTAQELLELLRRLHSTPEKPCTSYRLAKIIGMSSQALLQVINHGGTLSDENAVALAEELELPPSYVIICMHLQRSKDEKIRAAWTDAASKMLRASCFVLAGYLLHYAPAFLLT